MYTGKLFSILFILISFNYAAQGFNKCKLKKIHNFLIDFGEAVDNQDTLKLKEHIFPLNIKGYNYLNNAINRILNDQETVGMDFEYSQEAYSIIRDSLFKDFTPITEEVRALMKNPIEVKKTLDNYRDNQIAILRHKKSSILLILDKKQIQLFFMEGMNHLLQKENSKTIKKSLNTYKSIDDWYTMKSDTETAYIHYNIIEHDSTYKVNYHSKYKQNSENIVFYNTSELDCFKDDFLSVKSFNIWFNSGKSNNKHYYFKGNVSSSKNQSQWTIKDAYEILKSEKKTMVELTNLKRKFTTDVPTLITINLLQFITKQPFDKKHIKVHFNTMNTTKGPQYKQNQYIEYVSDELIQFENESIMSKKITHSGKSIKESTYLLGSNNKIIKYSINNYTTFILVKKNEIDFTPFD